MKSKIFLVLAVAALFLPLGTRGQTPAPVLVPAPVSTPVAPAADSNASDLTLKSLQEMKAANEATLKAQAAQLATLDELQKAAEEIKIYSKRG